MTRPVTNETMFATQYLDFLKQEEAISLDYIAKGLESHSEYMQHVGILRAIAACKLKYQDLLKVYFSN